MKIIGLTGGMGVGKSTVARVFKEKGYPIYNSDTRAKELMVEDPNLKIELIKLLGKESYTGELLNKKFVAQKIFSDKELLKQQNKLVHEAVKLNFESWLKKQKGEFCIKESAILFETGIYKACDYTIVVTAPEDIRIQRIIARDHFTEEEIKIRLQNQWAQDKLVELADFEIQNNSDLDSLKKQVDHLIKKRNRCKVL